MREQGGIANFMGVVLLTMYEELRQEMLKASYVALTVSAKGIIKRNTKLFLNRIIYRRLSVYFCEKTLRPNRYFNNDILARMINRPTQLQSQQKQHYSQNVVSNLNFNDDSLLDADDSASFDLRNENYELKSRCNALQYEKNKLSISYENTIKELKQKYAILERVVSEKNEKQEKGSNTNVNDLITKCQYLTEENQQLKRELQLTVEKNRVTPNFNAPEMAEEMAALAYLQKPENLAQLEKAYDAATQLEFTELKEKISKLQKENGRLREQAIRSEAQKEETIRAIAKQTEDHHNNILRFKDKTIEELKQEQISLNLQLNQSKKILSQLSMNQTDASQQQKNLKLLATQMREKDSKIVQLQEEINRMQIEQSRLKSEKAKAEQEAKYYESQKREVEAKRKLLQEQLFKIENQYAEVKDSWFNEKIQIKKQYNGSKYQLEEEINQLKIALENKTQQCKRLRDSIMNVNEENQDLKQRETFHLKKIDKMEKQIHSLNSNIEKLIAENEANHQVLRNRTGSQNIQEYQTQIQVLKEEINKSKGQNIRSSVRLSQASKEQSKLEEELRHKEELIQILMIEKDERMTNQKQMEKKLKQQQNRSADKDKVITNLELEIKNLKIDNRELQIAKDEFREKIQTLNKIKGDVEAMNMELKREKMNFQKKRKEQEQKIRQESNSPKFHHIEKKESKTHSLLSAIPVNRQGLDFFEMTDNILPALRLKESEEGRETLYELIRQLKVQNVQLQTRIGQVQNQLDKKAVDLSIKEEQVINLKKQQNKPKQVNLQPFLEAEKRKQFNSIFFENKISQLQRELRQIKSIKEKQIEEQKKLIRKQLQEKFLNEIKKQKSYIYELQKQANNLNSRKDQLHRVNSGLTVRVQELEQENYQLQVQLSNNLQELNEVLQKCKIFQQRYRDLEEYSRNNQQNAKQYQSIKRSYDFMADKYDKQSLMLKNANEQIRKLNDVLMVKESELKSVSARSTFKGQSPNNSFVASNAPPEKDRSMRDLQYYQKSNEEDAIRMWVQRKSGPAFSMI